MSRRSLLGVLGALAILVSACSVDATVTVRVREDGSGVVRVDVVADPEAVQTAEVGGGRLEDRVRLADVVEAGWTVSPWTRADDGSASLTLTKRFSSVDQIAPILDELSGPNGPLRDVSFTRTRSFFSTEYTADAVVDLGATTTGIPADADLVARLQAQGVDAGVVDQQLTEQLRRGARVELVVDLPGPGTRAVAPAPGEALGLSATVSVKDTTRITLVVVAALLVLGAVVVLLWPRRKGRRRRNRRRRRRGSGGGVGAPVSGTNGAPSTTRRGRRGR